MKSLFSKLRNTVAVTMVAVGVQSCGCDTWGCGDGLFVRFNAEPVGPWKIELFVAGVLQAAPPSATCDGSRGCSGGAHYNILPRDNVSVRITTDAGVRSTNFPRITYIGSGRSDHCHDCKGQAEVVGIIP